jgi:hypothetical protein
MDELIANYFEYWKTGRDELLWARDEVTDKVLLSSPEEAWSLVLELIGAAPDDDALRYLGAGHSRTSSASMASRSSRRWRLSWEVIAV